MFAVVVVVVVVLVVVGIWTGTVRGRFLLLLGALIQISPVLSHLQYSAVAIVVVCNYA